MLVSICKMEFTGYSFGLKLCNSELSHTLWHIFLAHTHTKLFQYWTNKVLSYLIQSREELMSARCPAKVPIKKGILPIGLLPKCDTHTHSLSHLDWTLIWWTNHWHDGKLKYSRVGYKSILTSHPVPHIQPVQKHTHGDQSRVFCL